MKEYSFAYGSGSVTIPLDERWVKEELIGNNIPALPDLRAAIRKSVEEPIGCPPLRECVHGDQTAVLVVSDMSRFWMRQDLVIPHLVEYLLADCGLSPENVTILVANGTHPGGSEAELRKLVTDAVFEQVRVVNHDCRGEDLITLGTTSFGTEVAVNGLAVRADLCICLGAATYHVMAGFGGGRKSILPGISGERTIRQNHALSLDPERLRTNPLVGNGRTKDNPLNLDMIEAAGMMRNLFMVNLVVNAWEKHCAIFSGHYLSSWERACREVERVYQVPVRERADVMICSSHPADQDFWQSPKAMYAAEPALKGERGGALILVSPNTEGIGPHAEYPEFMGRDDGDEIVNAIFRGEAVPGDPLAIAVGNSMSKMRRRRRLIVVSDGVTKEEIARCQCEHYPVRALQRVIDSIIREQPDCRIGVLSNGAETFLYREPEGM